MVETLTALVNKTIEIANSTAASMMVANDAWDSIGNGITTAYTRIRDTIITPLGIFAIIIIAIKLLISPDPQSVRQNKTALIVVIAAVALCWIAPAFITWAKSLGGS